MLRYRITTVRPGSEQEQTWVLLPDEPSALMQAEELSNRERELHIRVYREASGEPRALVREFVPRPPGRGGLR